MFRRIICILLVSGLVLSGCSNDMAYSTNGLQPGGRNPDEGGTEETPTEDDPGIKAVEDSSEEEGAAPGDGADTAEQADAGAAAVTSGGIPWTDSDIKENVLNSGRPDIKDDFNLSVNYEWLKEARLRDGYTYESPFVSMTADTADRVKSLLKDENITGHDAELVQVLYKTVLDWDARNELGVKPVTDVVKDLAGIQSIDELSDFICDPERSSCVDTFISIGNNIDLDDPDSYIVRINNDTLLLEDTAEYGDFTDVGSRAYEAKAGLFKVIAGKLGFKEEAAEGIFNSVLSLEEQIASASMTEADKLGADYYEKMNNVYSRAELKAVAGSFPIESFIDGFGYGDAGTYVVSEPEVIKKLGELYVQDNLDSFRNYMLVHYLLYMADKLDRECYEASVTRDNILSGAEGMPDDEDMAYDAVMRYLHEPLERVYLEEYDCRAAKDDITGICEEVIDAYREMLENEDWLSSETRSLAVKKLDSITVKAVYPDKWQDYGSLSLDGLDYVNSVREINRYKAGLDRKHTGGSVDKELWRNKILTANAYYEPQENSINIGAGILGDIFYNENMSRAELLGGIGCIIGHEISHAFDEAGSGFDENGRLVEWWSDEDRRAHKDRVDRLAGFYDDITAFEGYQVRGERIRSEAEADIAGMKAALMIANKDDDFDYDAFFRQYAGVWRQISTYEREVYRLTRTEYPLNYLRVNTVVQQFDEFRDTYGIVEGDGMYLSEQDRVGVW